MNNTNLINHRTSQDLSVVVEVSLHLDQDPPPSGDAPQSNRKPATTPPLPVQPLYATAKRSKADSCVCSRYCSNQGTEKAGSKRTLVGRVAAGPARRTACTGTVNATCHVTRRQTRTQHSGAMGGYLQEGGCCLADRWGVIIGLERF